MGSAENMAGYETNNVGNKSPDSERIEANAGEILPVPPASVRKASKDGVGIVPFDELVAEPERSRSKIRVFAIMTALFVSASLVLEPLLKTVSAIAREMNVDFHVLN